MPTEARKKVKSPQAGVAGNCSTRLGAGPELLFTIRAVHAPNH